MTRAEFLGAFASALERPGVTLRPGDPLRTPLRVYITPEGGHALARDIGQSVVDAWVDPITLVWWMRTGAVSSRTFLDSLGVALTLGLTEDDAMACLSATDLPAGRLAGLELDWYHGLTGVLRARMGPGPGGVSPARSH